MGMWGGKGTRSLSLSRIPSWNPLLNSSTQYPFELLGSLKNGPYVSESLSILDIST